MCQKVELQLAQERPQWMKKRHKYALLIDKEQDYVMLLARRHLEALEYLQVGAVCVCVCVSLSIPVSFAVLSFCLSASLSLSLSLSKSA